MSKDKKNNNKFRKFLAKTFLRIGLALAAVIGVKGVKGEMKQIADANAIKKAAEYDVGRSFSNLNEENMTYYEKEYLDSLYEKYPNLDRLINTDDPSIQNKEFAKDMYNLYKIDWAGEELDKIPNFDVDNLSIITVDRIISHADRLLYDFGDEEKKIKETTDEKNKMITTKYLNTKEDNTRAKELADTIYEFLAEERGLDENIPTSEQLNELVDRGDSGDSFRESIRYEIQDNEETKEKYKEEIDVKNNKDIEADERE